MTDEQIEKMLNDTYRNMCDGYQDSLAYGGKGDPAFEEEIDNLGEVIDYIKRLKAEASEAKELCRKKVGDLKVNEWIKIMKLAGYEVNAASQQEQVEQIRKETAKEILQELWMLQESITDEDGQTGQFIFAENIPSLAKKYGVEIDA